MGIARIVPSAWQTVKNLSLGSSIFWSVVTDSPLSLKETSGRTNILILGIAGGNHDGANLTDTMIFLSVDTKTYAMTMVSIPRDIWVDSLKSKINSAYEFGEEKRKGGGLILTKAVVEDTLGQPVHYALLINFSGFTKMIDRLGGLDIEIENSFDDPKYPIAGLENDLCDGDPEYLCRYERLHFDKGLQTMNGEQALKYVRSRQAEGDEGTDFARSRRQQKMLTSFKNKILSYKILLSPGKILALQKEFGENVSTDIQTSEIDDLLKISRKLNSSKIKTLVLDTGDEKTGREGLLINPSAWEYKGAWVLVPKAGNWGEIQRYIDGELKETPSS